MIQAMHTFEGTYRHNEAAKVGFRPFEGVVSGNYRVIFTLLLSMAMTLVFPTIACQPMGLHHLTASRAKIITNEFSGC
jgi:hypothetical protein